MTDGKTGTDHQWEKKEVTTVKMTNIETVTASGNTFINQERHYASEYIMPVV